MHANSPFPRRAVETSPDKRSIRLCRFGNPVGASTCVFGVEFADLSSPASFLDGTEAPILRGRATGISTGWRTIGFEWRPGFVRFFHVNSSGQEQEFRRVNVSISAPMRLMLNHWVGNNSAGAVNFVGTYYGGGGPAYYDWVQVSN